LNNTTTYQIRVKASTKNLAEVRDFISDHAINEGFSPDSVADLCLAVDEAYTNIIKHAYHFDTSKSVKIDLEFDNKQICVRLTDHGESFDEKKYVMPDISEQIKNKRRGGMGVYLIHKLMDEVSYDSTEKENIIQMCKKRD
jgi:serine/threonine-protein kinase RsbW